MEMNWTKALLASISETFSTMFFVVPERDEDLFSEVKGDQADDWLEGWIEFSLGGDTVKIWVWSGPKLALELAANILSCEPDEVTSEDLLDAYREMINMVAGNVLTSLDQRGEWQMGLPNASKVSGKTVGGLSEQAQEVLCFDAEERPLLAGWRQN